MDFLTQDILTTPVWMWAAFLALIAVLPGLAPGVLHKMHQEIGVQESPRMSLWSPWRTGSTKTDAAVP